MLSHVTAYDKNEQTFLHSKWQYFLHHSPMLNQRTVPILFMFLVLVWKGETNYYASNWETYFKKCISSLFIIVTLKTVPQLCDNIESNVICAQFGGAIYCKHIYIFSIDVWVRERNASHAALTYPKSTSAWPCWVHSKVSVLRKGVGYRWAVKECLERV